MSSIKLCRNLIRYSTNMKKVLFLLFTIALTSCGLTVSNDEASVKQKEFYKSYENCEPSANNCTYAQVSYPYFEGENAESLNAFVYRKCIEALGMFNETSYNSLDEAADAFIQEYAVFVQDYPENEQSWTLEFEVKSLNDNPDFVTLEQNFAGYTGGAHGNSTLFYTTFEKETAKQVTLDGFFKSGYENELSEIITNQYKLDNGLTPADQLTSKTDLFVDEIEPTENFHILPNTISFIYNAYDIAPYTNGLIQIEVPTNGLKHLIKNQEQV